MDVIPFIGKDTDFPVITQELDKNYEGRWDIYFASSVKLAQLFARDEQRSSE
jgi:oligo-1,6-glucosidase